MYFASNESLQNIFVYQLQSQKDKGVDYVISWKSKGSYNFILFPQYTHFLDIIKIFGYKIGVKFNRHPLVVKQNKYATKIANAYIGYELDTWPKNPLDNFTLKNCLFDATNIVKTNDKK